jgi:tRNA pseudouridine38-40 synthase
MTGEEIEIHGSGRTDGGVHAHGQVAHFHTNSQMSREKMLAYINEYLPMDIAVLDIRDAAERFHSRLNVKRKTYCYHIWNSPIPNVFLRKYSYQVPEPLDLPAMEQAASYLLGTHDFKSFCSRKKMKKSTVRMIESIQIEKNGDEILLTYKGNGFLYNMVRILTGTLIEVGKGLRGPEDIPSVIEAKNREMAGFTAPPQGLFLEKVDY